MKQVTFFIFASIIVLCIENVNSQNVGVSGRQIYVNDSLYLIKGICYNPVPVGSDQRSFENLDADLELMLEAGINTIRVYTPINDKTVLDKIYDSGIKVIMGFGYNQDGNYDILSGSYLDYIKTFKSHDVILFWELGNEYNYHPEWFNSDIKNWYKALNAAAIAIHETDSLHPVSTAHGELPDSLALGMNTNIDIWGMNVYRWDNPETIFSEWESICSKPMYLAEAGADSFMTISKSDYHKGENEKAQADATKNILNGVFKNTNICSGLTLFAFVDELWKAGNNQQLDAGGWAPNSSGVPYDGTPNEEYWGILKIDRTKKLAFDIVKAAYHKN